jgi:hypothetical protein
MFIRVFVTLKKNGEYLESGFPKNFPKKRDARKNYFWRFSQAGSPRIAIAIRLNPRFGHFPASLGDAARFSRG